MPQVVVGDVLKLSCDQEVPCDAIVLSSDHSGGQVGQSVVLEKVPSEGS